MVGLGMSAVLVTVGAPTALGAAAAEPAADGVAPAVAPSGLGGLVTALLEQLPLLGTPASTPTPTTVPEDAVADEVTEEPAAVIDVPELPAPITVPTVPTTAPPTTVALSPPAADDGGFANTQVGIASWYNDRDGHCAHRTAPIGTVVKVTNLATGASVQCTVTNRGPFVAGRVIDLSDESFARIAPLSQGLADVRVEW